MKTSHHVFIRKIINSASSFTFNINVPFEPTKLRVNYIIYETAGAEDLITYIRCSQLGGILGAFGEYFPQNPIEINLSPQLISGTYLFEVLKCDDTLSTDRAGSLVMALEFIKE